VDGGDTERTRGALDIEVVLLKGGEDQAQMAKVVGPGVAVIEDVVEEDEDEATKERAQHHVHERLERGRGIAEAEWHDEELVQAVVCSERRLLHICRVHPYLMVARSKVELGEEFGARSSSISSSTTGMENEPLEWGTHPLL